MLHYVDDGVARFSADRRKVKCASADSTRECEELVLRRWLHLNYTSASDFATEIRQKLGSEWHMFLKEKWDNLPGSAPPSIRSTLCHAWHRLHRKRLWCTLERSVPLNSETDYSLIITDTLDRSGYRGFMFHLRCQITGCVLYALKVSDTWSKLWSVSVKTLTVIKTQIHTNSRNFATHQPFWKRWI